jgi:hydroxypyruvate isomerase
MGENLDGIIKRNVASIGYVHVADFPGRHEPGTGKGDWPSLLRQLRVSGYEGFVGFEYAPLRDTDASLRIVSDLWEKNAK